ncbi:cupin domain-containing protein [Arenibaculum pallidiluteum]|uniref:cupin domain-containing protein n=1 Tax=Arenibaculum pallidiluteum TaxID=2812559 RepID=UPI001A96301C|nr:cupin domain-containing protein [Arenibaculum pallidiluteum]
MGSESGASRPKAEPTVQFDDAELRVTLWSFAPGAETGWHRHDHDYLVVPLSDGELLLETPDGPVRAGLSTGGSYRRPSGVEHNVVNANAFPFRFVEVEFKKPNGA